jgi:hypothetical protein
MSPLLAAGWGLAGSLCVEGLELYARIRRTSGWSWRMPIPQGLAAYLISVAIRAGAGAVLAAAAGSSGQVAGVFGAFALGAAAPLVVERLARVIPLDVPPDGPPARLPAVSGRAGDRGREVRSGHHDAR